MTAETMPAVTVADGAEQFGKDFRAEQAAAFGCGAQIECIYKFDGNCECFNSTIAHHRQAAMLEGARLMQEAAIADFLSWYPGGSIDKPGYAAAKALHASLRDLDPATVLREAAGGDA